MFKPEILTAIIAASAALIGVFIPQLFNHLNRREEFKRILFNEKLRLYSRLIGVISQIPVDLTFDMKNKSLSYEVADQNLREKATSVVEELISNRLLMSSKVISLTMDFTAEACSEKKLDEKIVLIGSITAELNKTCRKELGLNTLERELDKIS